MFISPAELQMLIMLWLLKNTGYGLIHTKLAGKSDDEFLSLGVEHVLQILQLLELYKIL